jgi:hypothetical protein
MFNWDMPDASGGVFAELARLQIGVTVVEKPIPVNNFLQFVIISPLGIR